MVFVLRVIQPNDFDKVTKMLNPEALMTIWKKNKPNRLSVIETNIAAGETDQQKIQAGIDETFFYIARNIHLPLRDGCQGLLLDPSRLNQTWHRFCAQTPNIRRQCKSVQFLSKKKGDRHKEMADQDGNPINTGESEAIAISHILEQDLRLGSSQFCKASPSKWPRIKQISQASIEARNEARRQQRAAQKAASKKNRLAKSNQGKGGSTGGNTPGGGRRGGMDGL